MNRYLKLGAALLLASGLSGCEAFTADTEAATRLFCAEPTVSGTIVIALEDAAGAPVEAAGATSAFVQAACAAANAGAIPVSPPANATTAPVVAIATPVAVKLH